MPIREFLHAVADAIGGVLFIALAVFAIMGAAGCIKEWLS